MSTLPIVTPMAPTLAKLFNRPGSRVRIISRNRVDRPGPFRAIADAVAALKAPSPRILDGEVCVFVKSLVAQFPHD